MLLSTLEIHDFAALSTKAQRMELVIYERNKMSDRERNKCGASGTTTNAEFKRLRDIKGYSTALARESQTVNFQ